MTEVFYFDGAWQVRCDCGFRIARLWPGLADRAMAEHDQTCTATRSDTPPARCGQLVHMPDLVILCGDEATGVCPTCGRALCVVCALPDGRCSDCILNFIGVAG